MRIPRIERDDGLFYRLVAGRECGSLDDDRAEEEKEEFLEEDFRDHRHLPLLPVSNDRHLRCRSHDPEARYGTTQPIEKRLEMGPYTGWRVTVDVLHVGQTHESHSEANRGCGRLVFDARRWLSAADGPLPSGDDPGCCVERTRRRCCQESTVKATPEWKDLLHKLDPREKHRYLVSMSSLCSARSRVNAKTIGGVPVE